MDGLLRFFFPYGDPVQCCISKIVGMLVILFLIVLIFWGGTIFANYGTMP